MVMVQVMKIAPADLRRRLFITIRGEEALDYGGVAKLVFCYKNYDAQCPNDLLSIPLWIITV